MNIIKKCPVCNSSDLYQKLGNSNFNTQVMVYGTGSFCNNCGTISAFNTEHLAEDIAKEKTFLEELQGRLQKVKSTQPFHTTFLKLLRIFYPDKNKRSDRK